MLRYITDLSLGEYIINNSKIKIYYIDYNSGLVKFQKNENEYYETTMLTQEDLDKFLINV